MVMIAEVMGFRHHCHGCIVIFLMFVLIVLVGELATGVKEF